VLVDTSLLVRALQPQHPLCVVAKNAIDRLRLKQRRLYVVPQNLVELWVVATRPVGENGLGMSIAEALTELTRVKTFFALLPETEEIFPAWERLVTEYRISGKPAHDARLVAAMLVHGLTSVLTFDKTGFTRYAGIDVVHPATVTAYA
jgi:predicted nucleic acid-binding protein